MRKNIIMAFAAICSCLPGSMQAFNDLWSSQVVADEEARQLYISPTGKDTNDGDAPDQAWRTWSKVLNNIQPGDVVNIMPGTYNSSSWNPVINLKENHSGTEDGYIYFRAYDPNNRPKFKAGGKGVWNCVNINASYIVFDGIEMEGKNQDLDSLSADNISKDYKNNDWGDLAVYNTNGINIGGGGTNGSQPHHVIIRNCIVHDFPGGGMGGQVTDYVAFENNTIYNNAWFTMYACSGISILQPYNYDDEDGYHNVVIGNTVYNNHTKIKWYTSNNPRFSDGNGIIMDINLSADTSVPVDEIKNGGAYRQKTLVANNVCYFNGGSGIHAFKAQNIDIFNNTTYMNEQRYNGEYGEIFSQSGQNNRIINNIMYSKSGGKCNNYSTGGGSYSYNLYYNGSWTGTVGSNKMSNPRFVHAPVNPADEANFHVEASSPAVGFGQLYSFIPDTDKEGVDRSTGIVVGAYQTTVATGITSVAVSKDDDADNRCYDLMGRPVTSQYHGIVIMKGKKIIMK